ncbi:hypothetical protein [Sphingobium sp. LB126]|uniref:hypothetical protein n=1 Tax=Sphingobium sp. LB126 TaxID=1983755 RepID=UPI00241363C1|nr:hypothetical protein [Sphingobium sp. LB126]
MARLPIIKTLDGLTSPSSHRSTGTASWRSLAWTSSTGPRWCICWVRPVPEKSHIATALAVEAVKAGKSVYFIRSPI